MSRRSNRREQRIVEHELTERPTVRIPRETIAECAAAYARQWAEGQVRS